MTSRIALAALAALLFVPGLALAEQKIAFVDTARAVSSSTEGKSAEQKLQNMRDRKRAELEPLEKEINRLREEYETQRFVLSKEALQEREIELVKKQRNHERNVEAAQEELEIEQRKLVQPIFKKIQEVLNQVADEQGVDVVLERSSPGILYFSRQLDITEAVIEGMNGS